jgi:hypothetical protein
MVSAATQHLICLFWIQLPASASFGFHLCHDSTYQFAAQMQQLNCHESAHDSLGQHEVGDSHVEIDQQVH